MDNTECFRLYVHWHVGKFERMPFALMPKRLLKRKKMLPTRWMEKF